MAKTKKAATGGQKKKKPVNVTLIKDEPNSVPHAVLHNRLTKHYPNLESAKIGLFWKHGWKAENDTGVVKLWAVRKASDTMRAVCKIDVCIYLNAEVWGKKGWKPEHADFVLDSALQEIDDDRDRDGEGKVDENNRPLYRLIKPTIQTFPQIIERHGFVTVELQRIAEAAHKADIAARPLFDWLDEQVPAASGVDPEGDEEDDDVDTEVESKETAGAAA